MMISNWPIQIADCKLQFTICNFLILFLFLSSSLRADDLDTLEQKAVSAAIEHVAPSVVRIETVGGSESVGGVTFGIGPTSGWIVDPQGYIVSSAFNFSHQPSSILVRLPDGARKPAKLVATDHSRMIVLLKVAAEKPLPVSEIAPEKELRVGQTVIALGRTFEGNQPNVSQGMLSAIGRVWGKAVQFDASASPANYGGPLIDLRGRVLGIIVPLSPDSAEESAGVEWYDSGIGFAIPAEHIQGILLRLKKGENLRPGVAGLTMKSSNLYTGEAVLGTCRAKSPAAQAGLKADDKIVEIDGRKITRSAEVKEEISRRYAGDKMRITVERGKSRPEKLSRELTLVEKIDPYRHPFLGILPVRDFSEKGAKVRYVYPESPAQKSGIVIGDVILSFAGKPVADHGSLLAVINDLEPGQNVEIEFRHGDVSKKAKLALNNLSDALPPTDLPTAYGNSNSSVEKKPQVGAIPLKIAEFSNDAFAYVPENYNPTHTYGLLVWLHGPGGCKGDEVLATWKPICDRHNLILLAPKSAGPAWVPDELEFIGKLVGKLRTNYRVDPLRITSFGQEAGGRMAALAAVRNFNDFRAWAAVDSPLMAPLPEIDPAHRFAVFLAVSKKSPQAKAVDATLKSIRAQGVPLTVKKLGNEPRLLKPDELEELARWLDMLDRL